MRFGNLPVVLLAAALLALAVGVGRTAVRRALSG
jgi:hypothetical protein